MRSIYTSILIMLILVTGAMADITINGDARVRPRLDITDQGAYGSKTSDLYYLYWVRLNVNADIGSGYYFNTQLAHNGAGSFIGKFGTGTLPSSVSYSSGGRGTVDFALAYFGHNGKRFSWSTGLIPVPGDIFLDAHFYPIKPLDIPWILFNNNGAFGADLNYVLAGQKLNLRIFVDDNSGKSVEGEIVTQADTSYAWIIDQSTGTIVRDTSIVSTTTDPNQNTRDKYSLNLSYPISMLGITVKPQIYMTVADTGVAAPLTMGVDVALPKIAGWGMSAAAGVSSQKVETTQYPGAYNSTFYRGKIWGKLGPGALLSWVDITSVTPELETLPTINSTSIWISYQWKLHQSDFGEVSLKPTYRQLIQTIEGEQDLARTFIELTTEIKFK
ncbi:MAG: hypothetical protein K9N35_11260 [Candidatus Marinimicrobia bacterium]|nr:hypothetical protein [Candidatus Neomarinimicrobiota bacterium]